MINRPVSSRPSWRHVRNHSKTGSLSGGAYVGAAAEGVDGGEDVDGDAEERGGGRDDAEAAADDEERVGAGARGSALPRRVPAHAGLRRGRGGRPGRRRRVRHG